MKKANKLVNKIKVKLNIKCTIKIEYRDNQILNNPEVNPFLRTIKLGENAHFSPH